MFPFLSMKCSKIATTISLYIMYVLLKKYILRVGKGGNTDVNHCLACFECSALNQVEYSSEGRGS